MATEWKVRSFPKCVSSFLFFASGDEDDEEDGGLFGDDNGDDNDDEGNNSGIMASDFFAPSTFEKRTQRVREELDELEADQDCGLKN